jgi:hypothetical protein
MKSTLEPSVFRAWPARAAAVVCLAALLAPVRPAAADIVAPAAIRDLGDGTTGTGRVAVYGPNRRYLMDAAGQPFVLIGFGNEGRNPPSVLAQLAGKVNYQRAYAAGWDVNRSPSEYVFGRPWPNSGGKADMDVWHETYWTNLRDYLANARDAGIVVGLTLWDGHNDLPGGKFGDVSTWNSGLNVQGVQWAYDTGALNDYPNPSRTGGAREKLVYYQRRWIDRLLQEVAGFSNLVIELDNETDQAPTSWWLWWADYILAAGPYVIATTWNSSATIPDPVFSSDPRLHMKSYHDRDDVLITSRYGWNKVIVADADNSCSNLDGASARRLAWRSMLRGGHWNDFVCLDTAFPDTQKLAYYGHLLTFLRTRNVRPWDMAPRNDLVSSGLALAEVGQSYLVHTESNVSVNLSGVSGTFQWQWYDPRTGNTAASGQVSGGAQRSFTLPGSGDYVLWITR